MRKILGDDPALYVHRSRLDEPAPDGASRVVITLIARDDGGRHRARHLLGDLDALIRIYPEGALAAN